MPQLAPASPADAETLADRLTPPPADPAGANWPPRPDDPAAPVLLQLWRRMTEPPVPILPPLLDAEDTAMVDTVRRRVRMAVGGSGLGPGHVMQSRNWCGLMVTPARAPRLHVIGATWTVPTVRPDPATEPLDDLWRCSTWVGLDGHFGFAQTLPQLGIESNVDAAGRQDSVAWFQWWVPDSNTRPHYLRNFPVAPLDQVGCYLWKTGPDEVGLLFRNLSRPAQPAVGTRLKGPLVGRDQRASVPGTTGEWVLERPMKLRSTALYPLPLFEPMTFDLATAGARGPAEPNGARDGLTGGRLIRLYDATPRREEPAILTAVHLAMATRVGRNGVRVRRVR